MSAALFRFRLFWGNPYTQPPNGMPRIVKAVLSDNSRTYPEELKQLLADPEFGPGTGWAVGCERIDQRPVRRWSQAAKARVRQGNLRKKKFPLFAEDFIAAELAARPEYYEAAP